MNEKIGTQEAQLILETLASYGINGCGIISLANKTGINRARLRQFLIRNSDFAVPVYGQSKFKINKFGPQKGVVPRMLDTIRQRKRYAHAMNISTIFLFSLFIVML